MVCFPENVNTASSKILTDWHNRTVCPHEEKFGQLADAFFGADLTVKYLEGELH